MPRFISKSDSTWGQNLLTFDTFCGNFVLKTGDAVNIFIIGNYEGLGSNLKDKWNYEMDLIFSHGVPFSLPLWHKLYNESKCHAIGALCTLSFWCQLGRCYHIHHIWNSYPASEIIIMIYDQNDHLVITTSTENMTRGCCKWLMKQTDRTLAALETSFMPVEIFVAHIPTVKTNHLATRVTRIGKVGLIARDTRGSLVS